MGIHKLPLHLYNFQNWTPPDLWVFYGVENYLLEFVVNIGVVASFGLLSNKLRTVAIRRHAEHEWSGKPQGYWITYYTDSK